MLLIGMNFEETLLAFWQVYTDFIVLFIWQKVLNRYLQLMSILKILNPERNSPVLM